jgi:hypothetical protein
VSRAQRSMSEANGALQIPISGLPEIGILSAQSRVNPTLRGPRFAAAHRKRNRGPGSAVHRFALRASRCTASGTRDHRRDLLDPRFRGGRLVSRARAGDGDYKKAPMPIGTEPV